MQQCQRTSGRDGRRGRIEKSKNRKNRNSQSNDHNIAPHRHPDEVTIEADERAVSLESLVDEALVHGPHEKQIECRIDDEVDAFLAAIPPHIDLFVAMTDL